jgi:pyruvate kinase
VATRYNSEGMDTRGQSTEIARALGIERAAVYQWKRVPPHWVQDVSRIIGVPPEKIRPDIFVKRRSLEAIRN